MEPQYGFIPVDRYGHVSGLEDVYAAGDAIDFPIKQGGLATQQADSVAHQVAGRHGAPVEQMPFRPVLRGMLLTGDVPRFLHSDAPGSRQHDVGPRPLVAAHEDRGPLPRSVPLTSTIATAAGERPADGFEEIDVPVTETRLPAAEAHDLRGASLERQLDG